MGDLIGIHKIFNLTFIRFYYTLDVTISQNVKEMFAILFEILFFFLFAEMKPSKRKKNIVYLCIIIPSADLYMYI